MSVPSVGTNELEPHGGALLAEADPHGCTSWDLQQAASAQAAKQKQETALFQPDTTHPVRRLA